MEFKKIWQFVGIAVLGIFGSVLAAGLLAVWPVPTTIGLGLAAYLMFGSKLPATVKPLKFAIVWAGWFFLFQMIVGALFKVSLESVYDKVGQGGILSLFVDPAWLGKAFLAQLLSLCLSGLLAWLFVKSTAQRLWVVNGAILCASYLVHSTLVSTHEPYRRWWGSVLAQTDRAMHRDAQNRNRKGHLEGILAEIPPVITIPVDGVHLYGDEIESYVVDDETKGSEYLVHVNHHPTNPDDYGYYVLAQNRKNRKLVGFFRADEVAPYLKQALEQDQFSLPKAQPHSPLPPSTPAVEPLATVPMPRPVVQSRSTVTSDRLAVMSHPTSSQLVPYPGETIVVRVASDAKDDLARLEVSVGEVRWITIDPVHYEGQWVGVLDFPPERTNPLNQPLLLQVRNGGNVNVNLEKARR